MLREIFVKRDVSIQTEQTTVLMVNNGIDDVEQVVCQTLQILGPGKSSFCLKHEFCDDANTISRFLVHD